MSADPFIVSPINEDLESEEAADDLLAYSRSQVSKKLRKQRPKPKLNAGVSAEEADL